MIGTSSGDHSRPRIQHGGHRINNALPPTDLMDGGDAKIKIMCTVHKPLPPNEFD